MNADFNPDECRVLVVDDDVHITELIRLYLKNARFQVTCAHRAAQGLDVIERKQADLVILDVMMPDMDGWTICQRIREMGDTPVLMVTAKGESADKLRGFGLGADDYLVKPFDPNELVARVVSLLRRAYHTGVRTAPRPPIRFDHLCVDLAARIVTLRDKPMDLTKREYQLLEIFARNPNHVLDRQQLLDLVWGIDYDGDDRVVDVFVKRLRKKLGRAEENWSIATVRGMGYKFHVEESRP